MKRTVAVLAACTLAACAGSKSQQKPVTVSDSDYGRLQRGQTDLVDAARADLGAARDAIARAKLRQTEAKHEAELAAADVKGSEAERMRADSAAKAAKESNDPAQLENARAAAEAATLRRRVAEAHVDYARKLQALRDAEVAAAEQRVALQEGRVEQAKLHALQQAQVPAATKYDAARLDASVTSAEQAAAAADRRVSAASAEMANAGKLWQELDRQWQASGSRPPRG